QWNDDIHHAYHVLATGESDGYYSDYADKPVFYLARCLTEGFAYQDDVSLFRRGERRGQPSAHLPPTAFVSFLQNHDQVGNRAFGERLGMIADPLALRAVTEVMLLAPSPPLLFMGEEFGATEPFQFFCNFSPDLAAAVTEGRRKEFSRFEKFSDPTTREAIPDPSDLATFKRSKLSWDDLTQPEHRNWLDFHRTLLSLRRDAIVPRLGNMPGGQACYELIGRRGFRVQWKLGDGSALALVANLSGDSLPGVPRPDGELIYATDASVAAGLTSALMASWSVAWYLDREAHPD
ncbi:MAG: DUF3459 domain-containing protein, partial [Burkholderiales bacterium]